MIETTLAHSALFPGNILKGEVALTVTSPTPFTALRVKVVGRERVTYVKERTVPVATEAGASSSSSSSGRGSVAPPQATERVREYVTHKTRLLKLLLTLAGSMKTLPDNNNSNNSSGRGSLLIPAGRYVYPFEIPLPSHIPPSYERTMSNEQDSIAISYHVKVLLVHAVGAGGRTTKRYTPFTVLRPMPLSQHQHVSPVTSPPLMSDVHCCWCFHIGCVTCRFVLERNRAILGDVLTVHCNVLTIHCDETNDMKEKTINALRLSLVEMTSYRTLEGAGGIGGAERKSRSTVLSHKVPRVIPRGTHQRFTESIQLQPLNAFASFATENVRVQYKLWVHLDIPCASEVSHGFDLLLGQQLDESDRAKEVTDIPPSTRTITTSSSSSSGRDRGSTSWWSGLFGGASRTTTAGSNDNNSSSDTIPVVPTSLSKGQLTMPEWYFSPPPEATRPELAARTRMIVPSSTDEGSMRMMMVHSPPPRGARVVQFYDEGLDVPLPSDQTTARQGPPPHAPTPRQRQVNPFRVDEHAAEARRPVMGIVIGTHSPPTTLPTAPTGLGYPSAVDSSVGGRTNAANVGADGGRAAAATRRANNNAEHRTKTD